MIVVVIVVVVVTSNGVSKLRTPFDLILLLSVRDVR